MNNSILDRVTASRFFCGFLPGSTPIKKNLGNLDLSVFFSYNRRQTLMAAIDSEHHMTRTLDTTEEQTSPGGPKQGESPIRLRAPTLEDGAQVWDLIRRCHPLDENSMYCILLQCDHFAETCVIAEDMGAGEDPAAVLGWISAYRLPRDPSVLFIWQVAVCRTMRGHGLARRMLDHLLARPAAAGVESLQTTITADNAASWALFESFADRIDAEIDHEPHFHKEDHFDGRHDTEFMLTIRPQESD